VLFVLKAAFVFGCCSDFLGEMAIIPCFTTKNIMLCQMVMRNELTLLHKFGFSGHWPVKTCGIICS